MTPNRRARVAGIAATIVAIPFLLPTAAGATATLGQSDDFIAAPAPHACAGHLWTANPPKALSTLDTRFVITGLTVAPGTVNVTEVVAWDGRSIGQDDEQDNLDKSEIPSEATLAVEKNEQLRIEYWKGDKLLAATPATPDLLDEKAFAWVVTPLGQVDIFETADRVEIVHSSEFMATDGTENSLYPKSVCIVSTPKQTQTTTTVKQVVTTAPSTTVPSTTAPSTTVAAPPSTTVATQVLGETLQAPVVAPQAVLARTGDQSLTQAGLGVALLGFGAGLVLLGRRKTVGA